MLHSMICASTRERAYSSRYARTHLGAFGSETFVAKNPCDARSTNGKFTLPVELFVSDAIADRGVSWLPIEVDHTLRVRALPWHHPPRLVISRVQLLVNDRAFSDEPIAQRFVADAENRIKA